MTPISLVVSDVDGTLLTKDKTLTDRARNAVQRLHQAGIGFTITSSRPAIGMRFLIEPLALWLPVGPFNGSSIVDPEMRPVEQHLIPASAAERSDAADDPSDGTEDVRFRFGRFRNHARIGRRIAGGLGADVDGE